MNEKNSLPDPEKVLGELFALVAEVRRHILQRRDLGGSGPDISSAALRRMQVWGKAGSAPEPPAPAPEKRPPAGPRPSRAARGESLASIGDGLGQCAACGLSGGRACVVAGQGASRARIFFVSLCPGPEEEVQGRAFAGEPEKLLGNIIKGMKLPGSESFFTCAVKCRPPGDRSPEAEEIRACLPVLARQVAAARPEVIVALGADCASAILGEPVELSPGSFELHSFRGVPLVATYHPRAILAAGSDEETLGRKKLVKRHMDAVKNILGLL